MYKMKSSLSGHFALGTVELGQGILETMNEGVKLLQTCNNLDYSTISNIRCTQSPNLNVSRLVLQLFLPNPMKPGVKSRMKMQLEQRRQAMLQLHLSYQQFHSLLRCNLYKRFDDRTAWDPDGPPHRDGDYSATCFHSMLHHCKLRNVPNRNKRNFSYSHSRASPESHRTSPLNAQDISDDLVQDCSNSSVLAMELLQSCPKPSISLIFLTF